MCDLADPCDIWDGTWPRARKSHSCQACAETIEPGHLYHRLASLYEGQWDHWKHCRRCWAIFEAIVDKFRDDGAGPVAVDLGLDCGESWKDVFGDVPPEVEALAFALPGEVI